MTADDLVQVTEQGLLLIGGDAPFLIQAGFKGDKGSKGDSGSGTGTFDLVAAVALDSPRVVAVANGNAYYPDLSNVDDILRIIGVTTHAANLGEAVTVAPQATFTEPMWSWVPGPIYCSETGGQLTQTPASSAYVEVGRALDANNISILIQRGVLRAAS